MPATESTWRNLKLLHVVFGVSSIAMLVVTIWMFVVDHNREWKDYQLQTMELESYTTNLRIAEQNSADYQSTLRTLRGDVAVAQANDWYADPKQFTELKDLVSQAEANGFPLKIGSARGEKAINARLQQEIDATTAARNELLAKLTAGAPNALVSGAAEETLRKAINNDESSDVKDLYNNYLSTRAKFLASYETLIKEAKFAEDNLTLQVKAQTAIQGKAVAERDQAIGKARAPKRSPASKKFTRRKRSSSKEASPRMPRPATSRPSA